MNKRTRNILIAIVAIVAAIIVLSMATAKPDVTPGNQQQNFEGSAPVAASQPAKKSEPKATESQKQALRAAEGYQAFMFYSYEGLQSQLVTFDKFSKADAKYAVDHLDVNWNEQATKQAQRYLQSTGFSKAGLERQLVVFDKFTKAQAKQAVQKAFDSADL